LRAENTLSREHYSTLK